MDAKSSTSANLHQGDCKLPTFQCSLTPVFSLAILKLHTLAGDVLTKVHMGIAWLRGETLIISSIIIIHKTKQAFILAAGILALTQILLSAALALTVAYPTDVFWRNFQAHNTHPSSSLFIDSTFFSLESLLSTETFTIQIEATTSS